MLQQNHNTFCRLGVFGGTMTSDTKIRGTFEPRPLAASVASPPLSAPIRRMNVQELLGTNREVILLLQDNEYRLRLTSKGKLILTK
jgi:hemin uptake protein HemP